MIIKDSAYLTSTDIIDWQTPSVLTLAESLREHTDTLTTANCFTFVRDEIPHCCDITTTAIPLTASEVLSARTGFCYAKSHLLAALLRANGIPSGFGYVRLVEPRTATGFALHGFNWVHLDEYGWLRIDARGNNGKVSSSFSPPDEVMAYYPEKDGEYFLERNFANPLHAVVKAYHQATDFESLLMGLPDI